MKVLFRFQLGADKEKGPKMTSARLLQHECIWNKDDVFVVDMNCLRDINERLHLFISFIGDLPNVLYTKVNHKKFHPCVHALPAIASFILVTH